jgi:hypothetical protein
MKAEQTKPDGEKEKKGGQVENDRTDEAEPPPSKVLALKAELLELERWGLLPPKVTEEMLSASGKEAPAEYREIISRYYRRMNRFYAPSRGR